MRKSLLIILCAAMMAAMPVMAQSYDYGVVTTKSSDLVMHENADGSGATLAYLPKGSVCRILEDDGGKWLQVFSGGHKGYVSSTYVSKDQALLQNVTPIDGVIFTQDAGIYASNDDSVAPVAARKRGASEEIVEDYSAEGWYIVRYKASNGGRFENGWVKASDVKHANIVPDAEPNLK